MKTDLLETLTDFVYFDSWFSKYQERLSESFLTFKLALNLFLQNEGEEIVETASQKRADNFSEENLSTAVFGEFLSHYPGHLTTCDIDPRASLDAKLATKKYSTHITYICDDTLDFLNSFNKPIDLLFLDSKNSLASQELKAQRQNLNELKRAFPKLSSKAIVLLNENDFPSNQNLPVKNFLANENWTCLLDHRQSLWIKP